MISYLPNDESEIEEYRIFSDVVFIVSDIDGTLTRGFEPIGKLIQEKKKLLLPISISVHHGLVDGRNIAEFIQNLKDGQNNTL